MSTDAAGLVQLDEAVMDSAVAAAQLHAMQCMAFADEERRQVAQRKARQAEQALSPRELRSRRAKTGWQRRKAREQAEQAT
jgi:hypothetical protein